MIQNYDIGKLPRYIQIKWQLQQFLADNNWQFDQAIPSEQELAANYAVSIGTVRKAIEGLVEEGVLIKYQGKGTFLKHPAFIKSSMTQFYLSMKNNEFETPKSIMRCATQINPKPKINSILGEAEDQPLIYLERIRTVDGQVILSDKIWLSAVKFHRLLEIPLEQFDNLLYPFYFQQCGQLIVSAKEQMTILADYGDPYLTNNTKETVVKICRIAKGLDGSTVEYRESYGLAKDFYYETIIT